MANYAVTNDQAM